MDIHELIEALRGIRDWCDEELVTTRLGDEEGEMLFVDSVNLIDGKPVIILST
jgi:hypothetical protein